MKTTAIWAYQYVDIDDSNHSLSTSWSLTSIDCMDKYYIFACQTNMCAVRSPHSGETPGASTTIQKKPSREEGALSSPNYLFGGLTLTIPMCYDYQKVS